jgi:MFS family permease
MVQRLLKFRTRQQPYMIRLSYRYEMRSALTFPLAASLAEGSFTGVVAAKFFQASPLLIAVITAAPMFGNIMAMVWSELSRSRRKVPFVNLLQLGVILMIALSALTAFLPRAAGAWIFASLIIIARLLASGIITVRSVIWRANYPRHIRGQIVGRITVVARAVLAISTFLGSYWLDRNPTAFVFLYPCAAVLGGIGIWQFSGVRVRKEGQDLRRQQVNDRQLALSEAGETTGVDFGDGQPRRGLGAFFLDAWAVLRQDEQFRRYQRYQFLSGFSFMFFGPALLYMVSTKMTDPKREYLLATVVLQIIPMVISLISLQLWAPLFDRVHITTFRVFQTSTSVIGQTTLFAGAILNQLWLVAVAQLVIGISNGGGDLAWNLGHNDFASGDKAATYMGIHVMLTGVRGCIAPFIGAWLYQIPWIGCHVFALSALTCCVALYGFAQMSRHAPRKIHPHRPQTQLLERR